MKIAFTYNLRLSDAVEEAEFDTADTVDAIARALEASGHEVDRVEVSGPASNLTSRLDALRPELIFNTAEGRRGRAREAFYPALFEELNYPYSGSDAYVLTVTLDKWLTKTILREHGIDTPKARLFTARDLPALEKGEGSLGVPLPAIVKPNFEGSSKGIADDSVARDCRPLRALVERMLKEYPLGVLVEEYVPGIDVSFPFVVGLGDDGVLMPVEYLVSEGARGKWNLYDYALKNLEPQKVSLRCPAELPRDVLTRLRVLTRTIMRALSVRDVGRVDFRLGDDGRIYFLEVNSLPSLEPGASMFAAARREGLSYEASIGHLVRAAARRWGRMPSPSEDEPKRNRLGERLRVGFNVQHEARGCAQGRQGRLAGRVRPAGDHRGHSCSAIESLGHEVVPLEANSELPQRLVESKIDVAFNIAEGLSGRNRGGAGAGPVRARWRALHRLGFGDARARARQGAVQTHPQAARHPHARVPGDVERAREALAGASAQVPAHREAERGGLEQRDRVDGRGR